jgi:hypothetical protein
VKNDHPDDEFLLDAHDMRARMWRAYIEKEARELAKNMGYPEEGTTFSVDLPDGIRHKSLVGTVWAIGVLAYKTHRARLELGSDLGPGQKSGRNQPSPKAEGEP